MPSLRSILAGVCLASSSLLSVTNAAPAPAATVYVKGCPTTDPALPVNGGATELAASNLTLAYVLLGRGIQNYTCASAGATPTAIGAVANLYDVTSLARLSAATLHKLAPKAVYLPWKSKKTTPLLGVPYIGHHFFDSKGTPVFTLSSAKGAEPKPIIYVAKTAGIPAPSDADKGPARTGAVDWLLLDEKKGYEGGVSVGLKSVYRVITAGGKGGVCEKEGVKSVEYATEYWLYK